MRCEDVIRELSVPTGAVDRISLAEHVSHCPRCAAWAERDRRLERLWEATKPSELSDDAWSRIWTNVSASIGRPRELDPTVVAPWRRMAFKALALAQAAAVVAVVVLVSRPSRELKRPPIALVKVERSVLEFEQDTVPVITFDKRGVHVRDVALNNDANTVDEFFLGLNKMESIAALQ